MKVKLMVRFHYLSLIAILFISFLTATSQVYGQSSTVMVSIDKSSYSDGDKMIISGSVPKQLNVPISIVIKDPNQNIVLIGQTNILPDNTFSTQVTAGGSLWTVAGQYEIFVTYGSKDQSAQKSFQYTGYHPIAIKIQGVSYNATYTITNGSIVDITPNTISKSLIIQINPSGNGILLITLPRTLIDSKTGNQDAEFGAKVDGVVTIVLENKTDVSRTLSISFLSNSKQIEIIGTQIVPEFGNLVFVILSITMLFILFYSKNRIK